MTRIISRDDDRLLAALEDSRSRFGDGEDRRVLKVLNSLAATRVANTKSLMRFHEALLFLRAFPHSPAVVRKTETLLTTFRSRVEKLQSDGVDLAEWDTFEFAGVAGTSMQDTLSFDVARWLVHHLPGKVNIDWDNFEPGREAVAIWPRLMPLLEDDASVEADTPWKEWLETAQGKKTASPEWLIQ